MEQLNFFEKLEETNPICPVCGNSFEKTRSNHVCCSQKCNNKNWNDLNKEKRKKQKKELYDKNRKKERLVRSDGERKQYHKEYSKKWYLENKQKVKEIPNLNSLAIIVEKIDGPSMTYTTSDFYELSLNGRFELASDWIMQGGNKNQQIIMDKYQQNNDQEHYKLYDLFKTLHSLKKFYRIELSDFEDNIIDNGNRYVIIDMGF